MTKQSLGLVTLPERTLEYDLTLLESFQGFSAELLRLALLGISAIGFVVAKVMFPDKTESGTLSLPEFTHNLLIIALLLLGVSAAAALLHRYCATDSVSWHLQAMRRYERNHGTDAKTAADECTSRFRRFKMARNAIALSALTLGLGAMCLVWAIIVAL